MSTKLIGQTEKKAEKKMLNLKSDKKVLNANKKLSWSLKTVFLGVMKTSVKQTLTASTRLSIAWLMST